MTALADTVVARLREHFGAAADPVLAAPMRAYMREQFAFLGIPAPRRRRLARVVLDGLGRPAEADLLAVARACWALGPREYAYFACDWLRRHAAVLSPAALPAVRELVTTEPWWDTVDILAAHVVGAMVDRHPALAADMDAWSASGELWPVRVAILHQLTFEGRTDTARLLRYCEEHATHRDFFVRKAIGWALREHAKTDRDLVRGFVDAHPELSALSVREALKGGSPS